MEARNQEDITIFTDGSVMTHTTGAAGWAMITSTGEEKGGRICGDIAMAELTAILEAAKWAPIDRHVTIFSDCLSLVKVAARLNHEDDIPAASPNKNRDTWEMLRAELKGKDIDVRWVRGHSKDSGNIRANQLARKMARSRGA